MKVTVTSRNSPKNIKKRKRNNNILAFFLNNFYFKIKSMREILQHFGSNKNVEFIENLTSKLSRG